MDVHGADEAPQRAGLIITMMTSKTMRSSTLNLVAGCAARVASSGDAVYGEPSSVSVSRPGACVQVQVRLAARNSLANDARTGCATRETGRTS
jgi:hypothetical protein